LPRDDLVYIGHMLDASRRALRLINGVSREHYDSDEVLRLALTHVIQTIGEAARHVSESFRNQHPVVPWPAIVGMRQRIVHEYLYVDEEIVWQTVTTEVAPLSHSSPPWFQIAMRAGSYPNSAD
jgi:uncharacterized protein with HEPN domain